MSGSVTSGGVSTWSTTATPPTRADCAVADYSRNVTGELAVVDAQAERDDVDFAGHRVTELTVAQAA